MISVNEIIKINKLFDKGIIVNRNSIEFALDQTKDSKDMIEELAYLTRAILIDHMFEEGNKRTTAALIMAVLEKNNINYNPWKVDLNIINLLKKNTSNINTIKRMIKNVIK